MKRATNRVGIALAIVLSASCSTLNRDSQPNIDDGNYKEALARLEESMRERPADAERRIQYFRSRDAVINRLLGQAGAELAAGRLDAAASGFTQVLAVDAKHPRAAAGLAAIEAARRHQVLAGDAKARLAAGDTASADLMVQAILTENPNHPQAREIDRELRERERKRALAVPALKSKLQNPVTLEFREAPLKLVMEALARSAGINFIIDRDVRPDLRASIFVRNVLIEDALDLIVQNHQLEKKVLNENTILIYPNTPQKLREHQELLMRTFQLGNADAKQTLNLLRTMLKTKDIYVDERVNMIVMRDTPDVIRAAERLIASQDTMDPEVVLELEILEVSRSKVRDLGISYPSVFSGPGGTVAEIGVLNRNTIGADSGYGLRLLRTDGDTKTLANPRVRVRNKEKARVHVGDRVPVISNVLVSQGSNNPVTAEQIQYLETGIKIEVEPTVHADDTVAIRINLDVSTLGVAKKSASGNEIFPVGTRNATTSLRLRDGETQALMGLIRDDDSQFGAGLPFIGEVPVLDKVFGTKKTTQESRELILLITPQLVRGAARTDATLSEFWSGTEGAVRTRTPFVRQLTDGEPRAAGGSGPVQTLAIGGATSGAAGPAAARATPMIMSWQGPASIKAGTEFDVELKARSDSPLKGVSVQLRYDPTLMEVLSVADGGFFGKVGGAAVFTPRIDAGLGVVFATLGASGTASTPGDGALLRLRAKLREADTATNLMLSTVIGVDPDNRRVVIESTAPLRLKALP